MTDCSLPFSISLQCMAGIHNNRHNTPVTSALDYHSVAIISPMSVGAVSWLRDYNNHTEYKKDNPIYSYLRLAE